MRINLILLFTIIIFSVQGQITSENLIVLDSSIFNIVPKNLEIKKLAGGFGFAEGPVWSKNGYLLFSDIAKNEIKKYDPATGAISIFKSKAGSDLEKAPGYAGPNGLALDNKERLVICEHGYRRVTRFDKGKTKILADHYKGKRLNSPNDVVCKSDGSVYFTDPPYGLPKAFEDSAREISFSGVYRWHKGKLQLLLQELKGPNGLVFSPDEKYLYIVDGGRWMRYELTPDGNLSNGIVFFSPRHIQLKGGLDGMKVDRKGNLYCTGPGGILVITPEGKHLGTLRFPDRPTNCTWGGEDRKTLYVTTERGLFGVKLNAEGIERKSK